MARSTSAGRIMKRYMIVAVGLAWLGTGAAYADLSLFKVFPNPVRPHNGQLAVNFSGLNGGEIRIYNANGRLVFETQVPEGTTTYPWNLVNNDGDRVSSGMYLYQVKSGGDERTGKLGVIR